LIPPSFADFTFLFHARTMFRCRKGLYT
jgi:hypothetical protein